MQQPLTNLQIWGLEDEDMPVDTKDYFEYESKEVNDKSEANITEPGQEID